MRGLKHDTIEQMQQALVSHPTWVRGLKQGQLADANVRKIVAPYVGAWIETVDVVLGDFNDTLSHPTWVRGLKRCLPAVLTVPCSSRTLRGCVD